MISRQCRKNETTGKLTVERAPGYLRWAMMKIKRSVVATTLCHRVTASTRLRRASARQAERGGYDFTPSNQ